MLDLLLQFAMEFLRALLVDELSERVRRGGPQAQGARRPPGAVKRASSQPRPPPQQVAHRDNFSRLVRFPGTVTLPVEERMHSLKPKQNDLVLYRRRMGFSQKQVARLLGQRDASMVRTTSTVAPCHP